MKRKNPAVLVGAIVLAVLALAGATTVINLATQVVGNLDVSHLGSGTGASSSTFWRGDGTWADPSWTGRFYGFAGGTLDEGLLGDGYFTDVQSGAAIQRDGYATPDANHPNLIDLYSTTSGQEASAGLANCADSTPSVACTNFQANGNFPTPGTADYHVYYFFRWQKKNLITFVQNTANEACTTGTSTCTKTITSTGAGHTLVGYVNVVAIQTNTLTSITDGGDTFTNRAIATDTAATGMNAIATVDSGAGGKTTLTCNLSANSTGPWVCGVMEFSATGGLTFDTAGGVDNTTAATTQKAMSLSLGGNDVIVQVAQGGAGTNSISGGYTFHKDTQGGAEAYLLNAVTAYAPTWTLGSSVTENTSAVAMKAAVNTAITNAEVCAVGISLIGIPPQILNKSCSSNGANNWKQFIGFRYSTNLSDTHWNYVTADATTLAATDSSVTPIPGDWVCLDFHSLSNGTATMAIGQASGSGGSAFAALGSPTTISAHLPTIPITPWMYSLTWDSSDPVSVAAYGINHTWSAMP
jgi:hypothetical protein